MISLKKIFIFSIIKILILSNEIQKENDQSQQSVPTFAQNCQANSSNQLLTGSDQLGLGVDLLYLDHKQNLFEFQCNTQHKTLDGRHVIPDGVQQEILLQFQSQCSAQIAQNAQQYQSMKLKTFNTEIDFNDCQQYSEKLIQVSGSLNENVKKVKKQITENEQIFGFEQALYRNYRLSFQNLANTNSVKLNQNFQQDLLNLPAQYNEKTYIAFIEKYGTHFVEQAVIGGYIQQFGYVSQDQFQNYNSINDLISEYASYFSQELMQQKISKNNLPNSMIDDNNASTSNLISNSNLESLVIKGGNTLESTNLRNWISQLRDEPVLAEQKLLNITNLIQDQLFPIGERSKLNNLRRNMNQGLKDYLINSSGCTDPDAINYRPQAKISDDSCFYSIYYASYQKAFGTCDQNLIDNFQLRDPVTNDYTCPQDSVQEEVSQYTYDQCIIKTFFCLRQNVPKNQQDITQSLQICQSRSLTNVFFDNSVRQQYYCPTDINQNEQFHSFFNIKYEKKKSIYTCQQEFCYTSNNKGVGGFVFQHEGKCSTYSVDKTQESNDFYNNCSGGCLIRYGKVYLADDCNLNQYICVNNQYNAQQCENQ